MSLKTTLRSLLKRSVDTTGYRLYVVKNDSGVLYVGQSSNIRSRIQAHISKAEEPWEPLLGKTIKEAAPRSDDWEVEIYTVEECLGLIHLYFPNGFIPSGKEANYAEDALIHHLNPLYNRKTNTGHYVTDSPFAKRLRREKEEADERYQVEATKKREFLVNSVCSICGERDTWIDTNDNLPCGVIERAHGFNLLCHSCKEVIILMERLKESGDRVHKVEEALAKKRLHIA